MTKTALCNLALSLIGEKQIDDIADSDDTSRGRVLCNAFYELATNEVLAQYDWRCARERVRLTYEKGTVTSVTAADPAVITITGQGLLYIVGDKIQFEEDSITCVSSSFASYLEDNEFYLDTNAADDQFNLIDEDDNDIDTSDYGNNVTAAEIRIVDPIYGYRHSLPSNFLALREIIDMTGDWDVMRGCLYCDADELHIVYTKSISIPKLDDWLILPVAYNLAAKIVTAIRGEGLQDYMQLSLMYTAQAKMTEAKTWQDRPDPDMDYAVDL